MVQDIIYRIFERTKSLVVIKDDTGDKYVDLYKSYLIDKYEDQLKVFVDTETNEMLNSIVDAFVEDEKRIWSDLDDSSKISLLEQDAAYQHLSFLSEIAFEQAKECYKKQKYYDNEEEYMLRLDEITQCLDEIKPNNVDSAKELLSETLLDIEYIFGKTEMLSLRLSRVV